MSSGVVIKTLVVLGVGVASATVSPGTAWAGRSDDAWARCLWTKAPATAENWLALPPTKERFGPSAPPAEVLLQYRLQAACHAALTPAGKRGPARFDAKQVRRSLEATRPVNPGGDATDPRAFQCTRYFLNDTEMKTPAEYRWGFGDTEAGVIFSRVQYIFAGKGGRPVGLPETGGLERCQFIQSDGTLTDA